ncbi:CGNR zinc finger domain-containing protein [Marinactinospora rubrisoli]|uniref:CGNR zinc finger domain-containing protein n=1 Tax=Marinactinospora rubrisoli TaxID=2715399 RepID=A0ABW2KMI6_9ACTN
MQFNTYGGTGAFLAADLVNVHDRSLDRLNAILRRAEMQYLLVDTDQVHRLLGWAARLDPVFGETDRQRQIDLVNGLLDSAATGIRVSMHDGHAPHLHYISDTCDPVERVRAATAGGLAVAICGAGGQRLGRCARPGCGEVFVDTSRNGRRRFCTLTCANRFNVAAHRSRSGGTGLR